MEIWIGRDGERHGPYQEDEVRAWLVSGKVSPADLAWREGLADWQPLSVLFPDAKPDAAGPAAAGGNPYAASSAPILPQSTALSLEDHAGFWKRVAAYIIDAIVLAIPNMLIEKMMGGDAAKAAMEAAVRDAGPNMQAIFAAQGAYYHAMMPSILINVVIGILYFALLESSKLQATLGKLALGIRVTGLNGARIGFGRALGRYVGKFLSAFIFLIGFMMVGWTRRKQGLHDMLAGTLVLNGRASEFADQNAATRGDGFSA